MEEEVVDSSVGIVGKKNYEEPESCGSAADFLLGEEMERDSTGRSMIASRARRRSCSRGWWWWQASGGKLGGAATTTLREQRKA